MNNCSSEKIPIYYCNQLHTGYKMDETYIKRIIKQTITPVNPVSSIQFIIYYRKYKTANLIIRNNPSKKQNKVAQTNLVYIFSCNLGMCNSHNKSTYIGLTTTSLSRRLTCHLKNSSAIRIHLDEHNPDTPIRQILVNNTEILYKINDYRRLLITEALCIRSKSPSINKINFDRSENILLVFDN